MYIQTTLKNQVKPTVNINGTKILNKQDDV